MLTTPNTPSPLTPDAVLALRRVQQTILTKPELLDMDVWIGETKPRCGTVGCIAGHLAMQEGWCRQEGDVVFNTVVFEKLPQEVQDALADHWAADSEDAARVFLQEAGGNPKTLFYTEMWPEPFYTEYINTVKLADPTLIARRRAEITAARIDHFIATGK